MTIKTSRQQRRALIRENLMWPAALREVPPETWAGARNLPPKLARVLRSRRFLVQEFHEADGIVRLSINRTEVRGDTERWQDGVTWDELQRLKAEAGYGDRYAVEVYPAETDVVNVGNLRHLWLLPEPPAFAWRRT